MSVLSGATSQHQRVQETRRLLDTTRAVLRGPRRAPAEEPYLARLRVEARRLRRAGRSGARADGRGEAV